MRRLTALLVLVLFVAVPVVRGGEVSSFLAADSDVVLSVNVEQLARSALGTKHLRTAYDQWLKDTPQAGDVLAALQFDPLQDVKRVTVAMPGSDGDKATIVVNGKFNRSKIEQILKQVAAEQKDKIALHSIGEKTVFEFVDEQKKVSYSAFGNDTTIIASKDIERVKSALGVGRTGAPRKVLTDLIFKANDKLTGWMVALPGATSTLPIPADQPQQKQAVDSLESVTAAFQVDSALRLIVNLNSKSPQNSLTISKAVVDLVSLLKLVGPTAAKDNPALAPLLDVITTIRADIKAKTVVVSAQMTAAQLEQLVRMQKK